MATTQADVKAVITAQDNASGAISGVTKSLGGMQGGLSTVMATALGFNLGNIMMKAESSVVGFVKNSLKEFGDYQAAQAQIQAVLKSTNNQYNLSSAQVSALGDSLKKTTVYTDEQTNQSLALLLSMKNLGSVGIGNVLSMSADLATRMGKDLPNASQTLGRALQDPANSSRLLRSVGLDLSSQLQKQIKDMQASGNIAGAQKLLMDGLRDKVGGAAKAYGDTFPGEIAKAHRAFQEFERAAGGDMVKALTELGTKFMEFIKAVQPLVDEVVNFLKPSFESLADTFANKVFPALKQLWDAIQPGFTEVLKIFGALIGVAIVANIYIFVNAIRIVYTVIADVIHIISDVISWVTNLGSAFIGFVSAIPKMFSDIGNVIKAPFKWAFNEIANMWNDTVGQISLHVPSWVPGMGGKGFDMPKIPTMAAGGIVQATPGGMLALLGEGGQNEAVIPLPKNGNQTLPGGTTNNVTVNINITSQSFMGSQIQARQHAYSIFKALQDYAASKNTSIAALVASS